MKNEKKEVAMKKQKTVKMKDVDRSFVMIPEVQPDHWRENLDVFFDENDAGQDHVRYWQEIGQSDVDNYYFTSGYEVYHLFPEKLEVTMRLDSKKSKVLTTRMGAFTMVYESKGCFRYALPDEPAEIEIRPAQ
jgi:hypothetical protein